MNMKKYVYIKESISKHFVEFAEPLKEEEYNNIGSTWQDFIDNKWVLLSDEQVAFREKNPNATVKEVWLMALFVPTEEELIAEAKERKLAEIEAYDKSPEVNSFTIGEQEMWLTVEERQQLTTQLQIHQSVGREAMTKWFNGQEFTFQLSQWQQMLIALEIYAGDALNVTESHKAAVNALNSVDSINSYDYTTNYPDKLIFVI